MGTGLCDSGLIVYALPGCSIAAAWRLLEEDQYNFLSNLPKSQRVQIRKLMIALILVCVAIATLCPLPCSASLQQGSANARADPHYEYHQHFPSTAVYAGHRHEAALFHCRLL